MGSGPGRQGTPRSEHASPPSFSSSLLHPLPRQKWGVYKGEGEGFVQLMWVSAAFLLSQEWGAGLAVGRKGEAGMVLAVNSEAKLHIKETPTVALTIQVFRSIARLSNGQNHPSVPQPTAIISLLECLSQTMSKRTAKFASQNTIKIKLFWIHGFIFNG